MPKMDEILPFFFFFLGWGNLVLEFGYMFNFFFLGSPLPSNSLPFSSSLPSLSPLELIPATFANSSNLS